MRRRWEAKEGEGSEGSRGSKRCERLDSNAFYSATFLTVNSYCKFRSMDGNRTGSGLDNTWATPNQFGFGLGPDPNLVNPHRVN